ncbi:MAG: glycosyltransferase family 2 protein [Candidatus Pseudobacter hemicellulosilyticus]|uniref:Glycosyltransferase family 2 protein n=1 Tax=Candidatus Pseudobacter hemicellulosilyticus TaxID=3121375 RepID=A0AAJ5WVI7_9BACT|nr:MAG: glycosyltransferase family 2 protein [Pseudobacter sp.]
MEFTILMPCLNEAETIASCIHKAMASIEDHQLDAEVLIADNGSTDGSVEIAAGLGARVVHVPERGYGCALRYGIENARGKYVIMADADDSYDFREILPFVVKLRAGYELVIGNRFEGGIEMNAMPFLHKYLGNPVLTFIGRLFFKIPVGDFHCGFRGVEKKAMLNIGLDTPGMEFASEMIVRSALSNRRITEVAVKLHPDGRSRAPHLRTWQDGWRHLRFLLLYCPKWLFFYPGLFLFLSGALLMLLLAAHPLQIGTVLLDVHTMLYAAVMLLIGTQILSFYFCSGVLTGRHRRDPAGSWFRLLHKYFTLERSILLGVVLFTIGAGLSVWSLQLWKQLSFGTLDPSRMLRVVIPAITFLMLGVQLIFNSFFASLLGTYSKKDLS